MSHRYVLGYSWMTLLYKHPLDLQRIVLFRLAQESTKWWMHEADVNLFMSSDHNAQNVRFSISKQFIECEIPIRVLYRSESRTMPVGTMEEDKHTKPWFTVEDTRKYHGESFIAPGQALSALMIWPQWPRACICCLEIREGSRVVLQNFRNWCPIV